MDTTGVIILAIESLVVIAFCALNGYDLFKKYKDKHTLNVADVVTLIKDLNDLAARTMDLVEPYTLTRKDFNTDEEYRNYLTQNLVTDFDELIDRLGLDGITNPDAYNSLSREDKEKVVDVIIDKFELLSGDGDFNMEITEDYGDDEPTEYEPVDDSLIDIGSHF